MTDSDSEKLRTYQRKLRNFADTDPQAEKFSDSLEGLLDEESPPRSRWEQLRIEINQYETEHPEFVALLNRIATTLSDMGI